MRRKGYSKSRQLLFLGQGVQQKSTIIVSGEGVQQKSTIIVSGGRGAAEFV